MAEAGTYGMSAPRMGVYRKKQARDTYIVRLILCCTECVELSTASVERHNYPWGSGVVYDV